MLSDVHKAQIDRGRLPRKLSTATLRHRSFVKKRKALRNTTNLRTEKDDKRVKQHNACNLDRDVKDNRTRKNRNNGKARKSRPNSRGKDYQDVSSMTKEQHKKFFRDPYPVTLTIKPNETVYKQHMLTLP